MKKIDRETVQRILDAADIVEVVSDFVSLKKRGANYIGLCPFHNERTPSFSVSRAKGICKCFSCGKGGSPVNFVMEHEQISYNEALRYLAKKYNIEIREHEMTDKEREEATERESLMAVSEFAMKHFEHNLLDTTDGRDIGLAYFRERGINDLMIKRFHLGYSIDKSDDFFNAAISKGFSEKSILSSGLCSRSDRGGIYDRFRSRVMYPIFSVSGRVIAFGGRTLRKDKNVAKYVNSPETSIYVKNRELYGLYQAKSAIVKKDKCILVEGYMDVISMHQAGVENVVASSGTSLTDGQIRLIHRFTRNVTVIYDSDPAGIKASLRGINMLLAEGLNIKVVLLPDGDDPDSFAQSHSSSEVEAYLAEHETDFIRFKTAILLKGVEDDPVARSRVITDILTSISVIPDPMTRAVYIQECSRTLGFEEKTLSLEVSKLINQAAIKKQQPQPANQQQQGQNNPPQDTPATNFEQKTPATTPSRLSKVDERLSRQEEILVKYIVKYGLLTMGLDLDDAANGNETPVTVLDAIAEDLAVDEISLTTPVYKRIFDTALEISRSSWPTDRMDFNRQLEKWKEETMAEGREKIRHEATDLADIEARELQLIEDCNEGARRRYDDFASMYLENIFLSSPDDELRRISTDLASEKYSLSKVHTKYSHVKSERERLDELVPRALMELKYTILDSQIADVTAQIKSLAANHDTERENSLLTELYDMYRLKAEFAKLLGDRIVTPKP